METNFNHEQSLALINEMISRARGNVQKERTYPIMFWGYMVAAVAIANTVLIHTLSNPNQSFMVWLAMIPVAVISYCCIDRRIDRTALVKTHIDKIGDLIWKGFGIGNVVFITVVFIVAYRTHDFHVMLLINPVIMLMVGICEFASACIYRYKPWYWVASLFWVGAIASAWLRTDLQFVVLAVCMILGFVIPGHLLNRQQKKSNV